MKTRVIAGMIAGVGLITLIFFGDPVLILGVVLAGAVMSYLEYDRLLLSPPQFLRQLRMVTLIVVSIFSMRYSDTLGMYSIVLSWILIGMNALFQGNATGEFEPSVSQACKEFMGYAYVVCLFAFLVPILEASELGREHLFLLFLMVFGGDTAAYFFGSRFGRVPLVARVSPKKTVFGAATAVIISMIAVSGWVWIRREAIDDVSVMMKLIFFSPLGSIMAQLGDLFESLLKRSCAQKDSGKFLPGHGGILDRVDGLAFAAPVYYVFLVRVLF